jgi:TPP-dependent pyruvate/acetoin dehydrogenase alpha subunit
MEKGLALSLYRQMVQIRQFEEELFRLFLNRPMPGSMHQYIGEEAVAVGVCAHLGREDYVTSTHRGHGHCIAKGVDTKAIMAEMFAKKTGCCKGMGGSMHIADFGVGMLGANAIVGAGIPIATGAGWSCKARYPGRVSVAFFGEGAANEGAFHEGLNLAAVWKLPVVFVCENNLYNFSVHYKKTMLLDNVADRAAAYGIPGQVVDGMDLLAVYGAAGEAVKRARHGDGPTLLECKTYRFMGHSRFEPAGYRPKEEVEEWKKRDPIPMFREWLLVSLKASEAEIEEIDKAVAKEIEAAVAFAEQSPDPEPDDYARYIFA